jgi:hypothetical protein
MKWRQGKKKKKSSLLILLFVWEFPVEMEDEQKMIHNYFLTFNIHFSLHGKS